MLIEIFGFLYLNDSLSVNSHSNCYMTNSSLIFQALKQPVKLTTFLKHCVKIQEQLLVFFETYLILMPCSKYHCKSNVGFQAFLFTQFLDSGFWLVLLMALNIMQTAFDKRCPSTTQWFQSCYRDLLQTSKGGENETCIIWFSSILVYKTKFDSKLCLCECPLTCKLGNTLPVLSQ